MYVTKAAPACLVALAIALATGCGGGDDNRLSPYDRANVARGAKLYDSWANTVGVAPAAANPGYALTQGTSKSVATSWRCQTCHGWDYKGAAGVDGSGSRFTGVA